MKFHETMPQYAPTAPRRRDRRYSHPILVKGIQRPNSTEELLSYILETLSHQGDLLEELLRRSAEKDTI